jgi:hypothetical protein
MATKEYPAAASRRHYEANKAKLKARAAEWTRNQRRSLGGFLDAVKSYPCQDCDKTYPPYVMDLDHLDILGAKVDNVANMRNRGFSLANIITEL